MLWGDSGQLVESGKPHIHEMHELLVSLTDEGMQWINGIAYPCRPGTSFFLPTGSSHKLTIEAGEDCRFAFICFDAAHFLNTGQEDMHRLVKTLIDRKLYVFKPQVSDVAREHMQNAQVAADELNGGAAFASEKGNALLCQLLISHYRGCVQTGLDTADDDPIGDLCRKIADDPVGVPSLPEAARSVFMSKSSFVERFKYYTGMTYVEYVTGARIRRASDLFMKENLPVTEVAYASGFNNLSYFHRVFKRETLMTPLAYKKFVRNRGTHPHVLREL